ncbi:MAG: ribonuclease H-like domain-containing protein [Candidatus Moraniibacteriota bacterium]|nr:MAG: ribonuclease H-like domain-containing protein [Candidatus Moranbacteria bacterium]
MSTLVLDIETKGESYDEMDEPTREALTRWIDRETNDPKEHEELLTYVKEGMGFSPLTGEIIALGLLDVEKNKSVVYFQAPGEVFGEFQENGVLFKQMDEAKMLFHFWKGVQKYSTLVTFNGRSFDVPFLMVRSAVHSIRPTKNFLSNRYMSLQRSEAKHVDLQEELSFYGALRRKGSLHLWCRAFGIESPKIQGVSGNDVSRLFAQKQYKDIARYNVRDIEATRDLYIHWKKYLHFDYDNRR